MIRNNLIIHPSVTFFAVCLLLLLPAGINAHLFKGHPEGVNSGYPPGILPGIPAPLDNVYVRVDIDYRSNDGLFEYHYAINNRSSTQQVYRFLVDISRRPSDAALPMPDMPDNACSGWEDILNRYNASSRLSVPTLIFSPDGEHINQYGEKTHNWSCGIDYKGRVYWAAGFSERYTLGRKIGDIPSENGYPTGTGREIKSYEIEYFLIQPDATQSGFRIVSPGLPGIRKFDAEQLVDIGENDIKDSVKTIKELIYSINYHGYTIGPVSLPAGLDQIQFIDYMQSLITQAVDIGWLENDNPVTVQVKNELESIRKLLSENAKAHSRKKLMRLRDTLFSYNCTMDESDCIDIPDAQRQFHLMLAYNIDYLLVQNE